NPDNTIAVALFNEGEQAKSIKLTLEGKSVNIKIDGQAIQTVVIPTQDQDTN
ncbi:MAG: hypothetical protein JJ936_15180, partial [Psychroserpens sp.]|nr:hypothetical protein [Psychroserpens sp.]